MAATTNGTLTPPEAPKAVAAPISTSAHKRKREEADDKPTADAEPTSETGFLQKDILQVLRRHDTSPSFLDYPLNGDSEPALKKSKPDGEHKNASISTKLSLGAYSSLQQLKDDAANVSQNAVSDVRSKAKDGQHQLSLDELKAMQRVKAVEELIKDIVDRESIRSDSQDGIEIIKPKHDPALANASAVLTLFGNAPTPKQLFSSTPSGAVNLEIEEMSLPNGLTVTKIMPTPTDGSKKGPTFEEAFPPPHNLPTLHPPKSHKRSSTRDNTSMMWEFKDPVGRNSKKGGYTVQGLSVGDWLGYGGTDSDQDAASPREKRKQRDRVLSSSDGQKQRPSKALLDEALLKEEEGLFRRAYSSFLPTCDNSKSIVPEQTKSMVWWQKVGARHFDEVFKLDYALAEHDGSIDPALGMLQNGTPAGGEEEDFRRVVQRLDDMDEDMVEAANVEQVHPKTDVEHMLQRVSVLLETLASHQRIRNASLPSSSSASRTPMSPTPTLASKIGKPDAPAEDEIATYQTLRHELADLILTLPPFAVAKLDGNQLADLGVSKLIPFEGRNIQGTMEEDQVSRLAKYNAMATAAGIATLTRGSSTSSPHYSTTAQRTPAIGQAANTRYGQSSQYGAIKTPAAAPQFQRSTSNQSQYGTPSATAPRPGYGQQPNQYARLGASQPAYSQTNGHQYYSQRPQQTSGGYAGFGQQSGQQNPLTQQRPSQHPTTQNQHWPSRSQSTAQNNAPYQSNATAQPHGQSPFDRTASPAKPVIYSQTPQQASSAGIQQRPVYPAPQQQSGSGRATPIQPSQPQTPVNGFQPPPQQRPVQPAPPRAASGTPQPPLQPAPSSQTRANGHA